MSVPQMELYFAAGFGALASVLMGIVITQLRGQGKTQTDQGKQLVRIETVLTGADGTNGLNGDVKKLKEWQREQDEHGFLRRIQNLERASGHGDRRQANA